MNAAGEEIGARTGALTFVGYVEDGDDRLAVYQEIVHEQPRTYPIRWPDRNDVMSGFGANQPRRRRTDKQEINA